MNISHGLLPSVTIWTVLKLQIKVLPATEL